MGLNFFLSWFSCSSFVNFVVPFVAVSSRTGTTKRTKQNPKKTRTLCDLRGLCVGDLVNAENAEDAEDEFLALRS